MTEEQLLREFATAWNTLDPELIVARLAVDAVYESQGVLEPLQGRQAIADYLRGKMATVRGHPEYSVRAEIGRCGSQVGAQTQVLSAWEGRPCVLVQQGSVTEPEALVLLDVNDGEIGRIDICTVPPKPSTAERTGIYPGLSDLTEEASGHPVPSNVQAGDAPDLGQRVVERLYQWSNIDAEWSVRHPRGFTWWAGPLAQHVWADPTTGPDGVRGFRVHARTDLITGFTESEQHLKALGLLAWHSTLSGCIRDRHDRSRIQLATSVSVHEEGYDFLTRLMALAAAVQVTEAHIMAPSLGALELVPPLLPAITEHPSSGRRENLDDMLNVIEQLVVPEGGEESRWAGPEMEQVLKVLQQPPCILATGDAHDLAAEFPFPGPRRTSLLQLQTTQRHPRLRNGCLCSLQLPYGRQDAETAALALRLNAMELDPSHLYFIGSWCFTYSGLTYGSFLPNTAYRPGALLNIVLSLVARVRWVTKEVFEYDMEEHYEETVAWKERQLLDIEARVSGGQRRRSQESQ